MRRLVPALLLAAAAACSSPCQDLATRICECEPSGRARSNCQRAVENQIEGGSPRPGSGEQDFCEAKLKTCPDVSDDPTLCDRLQTEEGKRACGLAFDEPAAQ